jgi:hypothetical protein
MFNDFWNNWSPQPSPEPDLRFTGVTTIYETVKTNLFIAEMVSTEVTAPDSQ